VILGKNSNIESDVNKASLKFELNHEIGSLSNVLQLLGTFGINLTKIQSFPIQGKPWQYAFFIDVLFEDYTLFQEVIMMLKKATSELKILGTYKQNLENNTFTISKEKELNYAE
jgi:prephenate dehydratase